MFDRSEINYLRSRVPELEAQLRDSVPRAVYTEALARIAALEGRVDWQADMLLRRGETYPMPPKKADTPQPAPQPEPSINEIDRAKLEAVIRAGANMGLPQQEIVEAVGRQFQGVTEQEIAAAIRTTGVQ